MVSGEQQWLTVTSSGSDIRWVITMVTNIKVKATLSLYSLGMLQTGVFFYKLLLLGVGGALLGM